VKPQLRSEHPAKRGVRAPRQWLRFVLPKRRSGRWAEGGRWLHFVSPKPPTLPWPPSTGDSHDGFTSFPQNQTRSPVRGLLPTPHCRSGCYVRRHTTPPTPNRCGALDRRRHLPGANPGAQTNASAFLRARFHVCILFGLRPDASKSLLNERSSGGRYGLGLPLFPRMSAYANARRPRDPRRRSRGSGGFSTSTDSPSQATIARDG